MSTPALRVCAVCDRERSLGFCPTCTRENFALNGIALSVGEMLSLSGPMLTRPELIVRTVVREAQS